MALGRGIREATMKSWWRRVRGALGMGLTWAVGWAPVGAVLGSVLWAVHDPPVGLMTVVEINAITLGVLGFFGGTIFSTVLRLAEGSRRFDELTLPRFAAWGAAGGLLLGGLAVAAGLWGAGGLPVVGVAVAGTATLLGAGSAAGSLALARQADDRELLEGGADVAEAGLTEEEREHLLG